MLVTTIRAIGLLISLLGYCIFFAYRFKWRFESTLLFTITSICCVLYSASLLQVLKVISPILFYAGIVLFFANAIVLFSRRKQGLLELPLLNIGFFIILYMVSFILTRSVHISAWDEFSHWGLYIKELLYYNRLPALTEISHIAVTYPPMTPIFQYFISKIMGQSEPNFYFAQALIFISFCMLFTQTGKKKHFLSSALSIAFITIFMYVIGEGEATGVVSLYADAALAFVFSGIVIELMTSGDSLESTILRIFPSLFCLTLIKEIGLALALIVPILVLYRSWPGLSFNTSGIKAKFIKVLPAVAGVIVIIVAFLSWQLHLKTEKISTIRAYSDQVFTMEFLTLSEQTQYVPVLTKILRIVTPSDNDKLFFLNNINKLTVDKNRSGLSLITIFLIFGSLFSITSLLFKGTKNWGQFSIFMIVQAVCLICYMAFLFYAYMFILVYADGVRIPSLHRYLFPFLLSIGSSIFVFFKQQFEDLSYPITGLKNGLFAVSSVIFFFGAISLFPFSTITTSIYSPGSKLQIQAIELAKKIQKIIPADARVFHIDQNDSGLFHFMLRYYMFPQKLQFWGWTFFISSDSYEIEYGENHRYESVISSPNKLFNAIKEGGYDYILITYGDKTLWRDYATIFDKQGDHHEVHLYHVGDKSLTLVE